MNTERGHQELAAQSSPCWRLVTAPPGADAERAEQLQWAHYRDADDAIDAAQELAGHVEGWDELLSFTAAVRAGLVQQREPCWVVRCRDCDTALGDEDQDVAVLHFDDPTSAYDTAQRQSWIVEVRDGTRMVCPPCQQPDAGTDPDGTGNVAGSVARRPGPGQLSLAGLDAPADADAVPDATREAAARAAADLDRTEPDAPALDPAPATAGPSGDGGQVPAEFQIARGLWPRLAVALTRGEDPGPRPAVFDPDRVDARARTAPETAMVAVRAAVGWLQAPHDQRDLAACLAQWRAEPRHGHHVKAEHAAVVCGRVRVAVATCGDCGYPVTRRGGATARWVPIWPHPATPAGPAGPAGPVGPAGTDQPGGPS